MRKPKTIKQKLLNALGSAISFVVVTRLKQLGVIEPCSRILPANPKKPRKPKTIDLDESDYTILK
jgi:hypothetical protein